jgi:hypothetical protein
MAVVISNMEDHMMVKLFLEVPQQMFLISGASHRAAINVGAAVKGWLCPTEMGVVIAAIHANAADVDGVPMQSRIAPIKLGDTLIEVHVIRNGRG